MLVYALPELIAMSEQDDPVIEYEDEFGRVRTARKSEIPRHLLPPDPNAEPPEEEFECVFLDALEELKLTCLCIVPT